MKKFLCLFLFGIIASVYADNIELPSVTSGLITSTNQVLYFTDLVGTNVVKAGLRYSAASNQFYFVAVTNAP